VAVDIKVGHRTPIRRDKAPQVNIIRQHTALGIWLETNNSLTSKKYRTGSLIVALQDLTPFFVSRPDPLFCLFQDLTPPSGSKIDIMK
jgi:hypothetical protein